MAPSQFKMKSLNDNPCILQPRRSMHNQVFENVHVAMDYLLELERTSLANDPMRQNVPFVMSSHSSQKVGNPWSCYFNDASEDQFVLTPLQSGRYSLKPNLRNRKFLFRGQSAYYSICVPNLFRGSKEFFLDDMVYDQELYILILSHPLCQLFDQGFSINGRLFRFEVNIYGLAQHYYNRTSLLDFTSSTEAAKFFAVTDYDKAGDRYIPVTTEGQEGCLYYYELDARNDFGVDVRTGANRLSTIGLQVFPRSERQRGFLLNLEKGENLNDTWTFPKVHCVKFLQHADISLDIVAGAKGGEIYFPDDILQRHWKHYNKDLKRVSLQAVRWNMKENPGETINSIKSKLDRMFQVSVRNYQPAFTPEEIDEYYSQVRNGLWEQFIERIYFPGDKDGALKEAFLRIPSHDEYRWAFEPDVPHQIDFRKGFLLSQYGSFLHP